MAILVFLGFLFQAVVAFGGSASPRNKLLWTDVNANGLLVTLNDPSMKPCSISKYPSSGLWSHPVAMTYLEHLGVVIGCGGRKGIFPGSTRDCYSFDGTSWEPFEPLSIKHYPDHYGSYNAYIDGVGWWVGGLAENPFDEPDEMGMINEVFTPEGEWEALSIPSPYGDKYPKFQCLVQINATHTMMTGGLWDNLNVLTDTWILNWETKEWTASTPMMERRAYHGCTLTPQGEVMILGGNDEDYKTYIRTVSVFNLASEQWRQEDTILPPYPEAYTGAAVLVNWNEDIIWLEPSTPRIWKRQLDWDWTLLDVTMGDDFDYYYSNVIIVPDDFVKVCN